MPVDRVDSNFSLWTCLKQSTPGTCESDILPVQDLNKCNDVPDNNAIPVINGEFSWPPQEGGFQITFKNPYLVAGCTYVVSLFQSGDLF